MLYREPKLLKGLSHRARCAAKTVSVLYREPKLLKVELVKDTLSLLDVSVLYREPKLLKALAEVDAILSILGFSALP